MCAECVHGFLSPLTVESLSPDELAIFVDDHFPKPLRWNDIDFSWSFISVMISFVGTFTVFG